MEKGGHSAALISLHNIILTALEICIVGLFHRVIAQSGSALASYSYHHSPLVNFTEYVHKVGDIFECNERGITHILQCLRRIHFTEFITRRQKVNDYLPCHHKLGLSRI